jgi:hypothetical protein
VLVSLTPQLRLEGFFIGTSGRKRNQILVRQLVIVWPHRRWIGAQLTGTQIWPLLNAHVVFQEKRQISGYHQPYIGLPLFNAIKLVGAYVVMLIEAHVSQLHNRLLSKRAWSKRALGYFMMQWPVQLSGKVLSEPPSPPPSPSSHQPSDKPPSACEFPQ